MAVELRHWLVEDAGAQARAIGESLEHLRPWMPWAADEPKPPEERVAMIRGWEAERRAGTGEYFAVRDDPRVMGGARLQPIETATTLRSADGDTLVTDGPFADTKEVFGGFFLMEADSLDGALELAGRLPALRMGGAVEIRPLVEYPR